MLVIGQNESWLVIRQCYILYSRVANIWNWTFNRPAPYTYVLFLPLVFILIILFLKLLTLITKIKFTRHVCQSRRKQGYNTKCNVIYKDCKDQGDLIHRIDEVIESE